MQGKLLNVAGKTRYPPAAFVFVQRGLDFTVRRVHGDPEKADPEVSRHITGPQLCVGMRDFAIEEYGLMARTVLKQWGIVNCEDFGRIVFALVDAGMMHKTDEDRIDDFVGVLDFKDAFATELTIAENS